MYIKTLHKVNLQEIHTHQSKFDPVKADAWKNLVQKLGKYVGDYYEFSEEDWQRIFSNRTHQCNSKLMHCLYLIQLLSHGVHCRKNGSAETTCSPGVCLYCEAGGGKDATWKLHAWSTALIAQPSPVESKKIETPRRLGPGTQLATLLKSLGLTEASIPRVGQGCGCKDLAAVGGVDSACGWLVDEALRRAARGVGGVKTSLVLLPHS